MELIIKTILPSTPDALTVNGWLESEWPGLLLNQWLSKESLIGESDLPIVFLAKDKKAIPVGCISILNNDIEHRPDLNPWIGCLFVPVEFRMQGIGRQLLQAAIKWAQIELGLSNLSLFCELYLVNFYKSEGWEIAGEEQYEGKTVTIMNRKLS